MLTAVTVPHHYEKRYKLMLQVAFFRENLAKTYTTNSAIFDLV